MTDEQLLAGLKAIRTWLREERFQVTAMEFAQRVAPVIKPWMASSDEPVQTFEPSPSSE